MAAMAVVERIRDGSISESSYIVMIYLSAKFHAFMKKNTIFPLAAGLIVVGGSAMVEC